MIVWPNIVIVEIIATHFHIGWPHTWGMGLHRLEWIVQVLLVEPAGIGHAALVVGILPHDLLRVDLLNIIYWSIWSNLRNIVCLLVLWRGVSLWDMQLRISHGVRICHGDHWWRLEYLVLKRLLANHLPGIGPGQTVSRIWRQRLLEFIVTETLGMKPLSQNLVLRVIHVRVRGFGIHIMSTSIRLRFLVIIWLNVLLVVW